MSSSNLDLLGSLCSAEGVNLASTGKNDQRWCLWLPGMARPRASITIPWCDVLSATSLTAKDESEAQRIELSYVRHTSNDPQSPVYPATQVILLPPSLDSQDGEKIAQSLIERAYPNTQYRKRILVLVNPFSGKGKGAAEKKYHSQIEPVFNAAKCEVTVVRTTHKGHAIEVTRDLDIEKYDVVACCSGDGVPHEAFNGLSQRADARKALAKLAVVQLPCGSGNGMSWNCFDTGTHSVAALRLVKAYRTPMDLVSITYLNPEDPDKVERMLSFLTQAVGVIADCDLGTEHLRFLGESRFALGLIYKIVRKQLYPCDIALAVDKGDKEDIRQHFKDYSELPPDYLNPAKRDVGPGLPPLKYGTIRDELPEGWKMEPHDKIGNFYCGNVVQVQQDTPFFPVALPADGLMDLVTVNGDIATWPALMMMDDCPKNKLLDNPIVSYQKVTGYRLIPKAKTGHISVDGEPIPHAPYQAEVHPKLGTTLTLTGRVFEGPGVPKKTSAS